MKYRLRDYLALFLAHWLGGNIQVWYRVLGGRINCPAKKKRKRQDAREDS